MGATLREGIRDRGRGFITTSVIDPFANVLGIMYNPHYLDILAGLRLVPKTLKPR